MEIRSTFRNHPDTVMSYGGTQKEWPGPLLVGVQAIEKGRRQIRARNSRWRVRRGSDAKEAGRTDCRENPLCQVLRCPYRKPTQVGEVSIQRRSGEILLRNSAI